MNILDDNIIKKSINRKTKKTIFVMLMLAVPVLHFFVFWLWVNTDSILLAFRNLSGDWVGLTNIKSEHRRIKKRYSDSFYSFLTRL